MIVPKLCLLHNSFWGMLPKSWPLDSWSKSVANYGLNIHTFSVCHPIPLGVAWNNLYCVVSILQTVFIKFTPKVDHSEISFALVLDDCNDSQKDQDEEGH